VYGIFHYIYYVRIYMKMLSRNKIKYLASLKIKKFRMMHRQFIMEGDKIVRDILKDGPFIRQLIATRDWLSAVPPVPPEKAGEIIEADINDMARISSMETPVPVLAVMDITDMIPDLTEISGKWSIALDTIQDPGNLGTIIRTADWFGIRHILCNEGCADCYNPKAIQASMGSVLRVKVYYAGLPELIPALHGDHNYSIIGAFTEGISVYDLPPATRGMVIFGNESRGISEALLPFITTRITIPPGYPGISHVESLNVASAVAVVCSSISRF